MVTESLVNPNLQETEFQNTLWKVDDQVSEKPVPLGRHGLVMKKLQRFRPAGAGSTEQSLLAQTVASKDAVAVMIDSQVLLFCSKGQSFLSSIILGKSRFSSVRTIFPLRSLRLSTYLCHF